MRWLGIFGLVVVAELALGIFLGRCMRLMNEPEELPWLGS